MRVRIFYPAALLIFFNLSINCFAQYHWSSIGPGAGSDLKSIAIHPLDPDIVYVGGDIEGIFKTINGGESWTNINNNLAKEYSAPDIMWIQEIVFDPSDPTFESLYICTLLGLFKTTNGGEHWNLVYPKNMVTEEDLIVASYLAIDPYNANKLWLGTGIAYESVDGSGLIYYSEDKGENWEEIRVTPGNSVVHGISIDPLSSTNNRTVYLSTDAGFYVSNDNGVSWAAKNIGLPHTNLRRLKCIEVNGNTILYLTLTTLGTPGNPGSFNGGLYKSTDRADTWIDITGNLPQYQEDETKFYFYWKFSVDPTDPNTILIATVRGWPDEELAGWEDWGIYKTINGGQNWNRINNNVTYGWLNPTFFEEENAFVLEMAPSNPDIIYWGIDWMTKSTDGGDTWRQIYTTNINGGWRTTGMELMVADDMAYDPLDEDVMYLAYDDFGIFRSNDGGDSFTPLDPTQDPYDGYDAAKDLALDPHNGDIYMSRWDGLGDAMNSNFALGQVWKSEDHGNNWIKVSSGLPDGRPELILDENSGAPGNRTLYCTIYGSGVYKSVNSGAGWTAISNGLGNDAARVWEIAIDPSNSQILYVGTNTMGGGGALYKTDDAGGLWTKLNSFPTHDVLKLLVDESGNVYAGTTDSWEYNTDGGLYRSEDGGNNWTKIFNSTRCADVDIDPDNSNIIYTVSQAWYIWNRNIDPGIFKSVDRGATWEDVTGDLPNTFIRFVDLHPGSKYYAGTHGGGVFILSDTSPPVNVDDQIPLGFELYQNYPNPFNPTTRLMYKIYESANVSINIYNVTGQLVKTILSDYKSAGVYELSVNLEEFPTGVYFYRLTSRKKSVSKKMVLLK